MPILPDFQNIPTTPINFGNKNEASSLYNFPVEGDNLKNFVDLNQKTFKYGLHQKYDKSLSDYEDPTYLGFTLEIDPNSAIFNNVLPFLNEYSSTRGELKARIPIYNEFVQKIKQLFNSQDSVVDSGDSTQFVKQHYINNISGLQHLQQKVINWKEDKLSLELYEDIAQFSSYVAHLYNSLEYSYINQRVIIPENLLYFNLIIRFSEIRNLTSTEKNRDYTRDVNPDIESKSNALKYNVTSITYKLVDCKFDFFDSKPFEDTVTQSGIDATFPAASILGFDIYFRSVRRQMFNPLINGAVSFNDGDPQLRVVELDNIITKTLQNSSYDTQAFTNSIAKGDSDYYSTEIDPTTGKETFSNSLKDHKKSIDSIQSFNNKLDPSNPLMSKGKQFFESKKKKIVKAFQTEVQLEQARLVTAANQKINLARQKLINEIKTQIMSNKYVNQANVQINKEITKFNSKIQ